MTVLLNATKCRSCHILVPYVGAFVADLELDGDDPIPTGKVTLKIGDETFPCTVDPRSTGSFVTRKKVRVVAGGGAWDSAVIPQQFHGNVNSTQVYNQTAAAIGETVTDPSPIDYGTDWVRPGGAAMRVFGDRNWYVDPLTGVTQVSDWPATTQPSDLVIADYDPAGNTVMANSAMLIRPGTTLVDDRFNGASVIVRDVEQTFDEDGTSATLSCAAAPISRLSSALTDMVREFAGSARLQTYLYRFAVPGSGTDLVLQAITPGAPDLNPISQWTGLYNATAKVAPGVVIVVGFAGGDWSTPYIVSYSPMGAPAEIDLAGGANYLVPAPWAAALSAALVTFATGLTPITLPAQAAALVTALATPPLVAYSTILTKAT